jgi:hypothetical protein
VQEIMLRPQASQLSARAESILEVVPIIWARRQNPEWAPFLAFSARLCPQHLGITLAFLTCPQTM